MLPVRYFSLLTLLAGVLAFPVHTIDKRALPRLGGVNLAGCDFGMDTNGTVYCPGTDQISHFASKGSNLFRLPVGWQYLVGNNQASTSLDATFFATYDNLVKTALATGSYVMIDIHNYARWNGGVVGQGGPTDANFASLWSLLAAKYKSESKVIFGIMNEPHDIDISKWATTVQAAVNAIRAAGATTQSIALPGNQWTHPEGWTSGTNDPLLSITDPADSSGSLLIIDAHKYYDGDGSGQSTECVTNAVDVYTAFRTWLKAHNKKAIISETGGGNTASCQTNVGQALKYISENTDAFIGFTVWSAGSFDSSYALSITPVNGQDNDLFVKAIQPYLPGGSGGTASSSAVPSSSKAASSTIASTSKAASSVPVPSSTSKVVSSTSRAPISTTSKAVSSAVVTSTSRAASSAVVISKSATPSSSSAPIPSSSVVLTSKAPTSTSSASPSTTSSAGSNLQKFTGALGGFAAPPVTQSGNRYTTNGQTYNFLIDALNSSCYAQMNTCQNEANKTGNKGDLTVGNCNGQQVQDCLKVASSS
uniref:cellulase n=1 Tax=Kwoniella bestiolae CBS 10118 TaxID=1296100 RepID=A0A1B9G7L9_9TREE|nr:hypothetical protein I302_01862 [Kwoniella bestiolae CBS 10118]OCF27027.1 hypothetical protein I302_01862 [Kwoniella bestiolae CBS 10118]